MSSSVWLRPLAHRLFGPRRRTASASRPAVAARQRARPCLEVLEDRITPSVNVTVTDLNDDGAGSLRDAITQANNDTGTATDTIQLQAGTYKLTLENNANKHEQENVSGDLNITSTSHDLLIQGATDDSGHTTTIIQQTVFDRVLQIALPHSFSGPIPTVTFKNLVIQGGYVEDDGGAGTVAGSADAYGGGILDDGGNVRLSNVVLENNIAQAGAGHGAAGGGIFATGGVLLTINSSVIQFNEADGGAGTSLVDGGSAQGGGIYSAAGLSSTNIAHSSVHGNTLRGGNQGNGDRGGDAFGGGIYVAYGSAATITSSNLSENELIGGNGESGGRVWGGGVFAEGTTTISTSILSSNTLTGGIGNLDYSDLSNIFDVGGEAAGGGVYADGTTTIASSNLSGNTLTGGDGSLSRSSSAIIGDVGGEALGGAVYVDSTSTTTINTSILSGNALTGGKGTYISGIVKGNIGGSASGGGVYISRYSTATTITSSTLSDNTVTSGGASGGSGTVGASQGGGAYFANAGNKLINSTIAGNQANGAAKAGDAEGGGLFFGNMATATLTNDTVANNKANPGSARLGNAAGGGIDNTNTAAQAVTVANTLVALNNANTGPDYAGTVSSGGHNLTGIQDGSSGFGATGDQLGKLASPLDPLLGPLQNNGGASAGAPGTQQVAPTMALLPGSPAINAGDNNAQSVTGPNDQRGPGFARVVNGTIDIGAFEVQPPPSQGGGGSSSSPAPPPTLHTPPLLAFFDALLGGMETINSNDTETVIDRIFGIPLFISLYDGAGNLVSVTLFGIDVTLLIETL